MRHLYIPLLTAFCLPVFPLLPALAQESRPSSKVYQKDAAAFAFTLHIKVHRTDGKPNATMTVPTTLERPAALRLKSGKSEFHAVIDAGRNRKGGVTLVAKLKQITGGRVVRAERVERHLRLGSTTRIPGIGHVALLEVTPSLPR